MVQTILLPLTTHDVDDAIRSSAALADQAAAYGATVVVLETDCLHGVLTSIEPGYEDMTGIARALIDAAPERLVWASDWPHTGGSRTGSDDRSDRGVVDIEPFRQVDVSSLLSLLADWSGDAKTWRRILVDNPAALYGFS